MNPSMIAPAIRAVVSHQLINPIWAKAARVDQAAARNKVRADQEAVAAAPKNRDRAVPRPLPAKTNRDRAVQTTSLQRMTIKGNLAGLTTTRTPEINQTGGRTNNVLTSS